MRSSKQGFRKVPPFFGRQLRQKGRHWSIYSELSVLHERKESKLCDCPIRLRRIIAKVFQGLGIAKKSAAGTAAAIFNQALENCHGVLTKFFELGMQAVRCHGGASQLSLDLKFIGAADTDTFTLCDSTFAFVGS